eukprot:3364647-Amphidinium_carterae.1
MGIQLMIGWCVRQLVAGPCLAWTFLGRQQSEGHSMLELRVAHTDSCSGRHCQLLLHRFTGGEWRNSPARAGPSAAH